MKHLISSEAQAQSLQNRRVLLFQRINLRREPPRATLPGGNGRQGSSQSLRALQSSQGGPVSSASALADVHWALRDSSGSSKPQGCARCWVMRNPEHSGAQVRMPDFAVFVDILFSPLPSKCWVHPPVDGKVAAAAPGITFS